jgi:general secretion pathway protein C
MNRPLNVTLNGALLVLACWIAAGIVAEVAGALLAPPTSAPAVTPAVAPDREKTWSDREVILTRNLFNVSTLAPEATVHVEESETYEKTRLPVKLLGTAASGDPSHSWAAVEDQESRGHLVVRVGDQLLGRAEVLRIERRRLVLQNGDRREELALEEQPDGGAKVSRASPKRPTPRRRPRATRGRSDGAQAEVERLDENRYAVKRADVDDLASNPAGLFSQARILPKYEDGGMVGVQLNAIKSGSLFERIGIQNGDVITQLNGIEVTGPETSQEMLKELTEAQEFNLTVMGSDGGTRELEYEVR